MSVPFSNTRLRVPKGFQNVLEGLAREVLRSQPENILSFSEAYFEELLRIRQETGYDDITLLGAKLEDRFYNNHSFKNPNVNTNNDEQQSAAVVIQSEFRRFAAKKEVDSIKEDEAATVIQASFRGHIERETIKTKDANEEMEEETTMNQSNVADNIQDGEIVGQEVYEERQDSVVENKEEAPTDEVVVEKEPEEQQQEFVVEPDVQAVTVESEEKEITGDDNVENTTEEEITPKGIVEPENLEDTDEKSEIKMTGEEEVSVHDEEDKEGYNVQDEAREMDALEDDDNQAVIEEEKLFDDEEKEEGEEITEQDIEQTGHETEREEQDVVQDGDGTEREEHDIKQDDDKAELEEQDGHETEREEQDVTQYGDETERDEQDMAKDDEEPENENIGTSEEYQIVEESETNNVKEGNVEEVEDTERLLRTGDVDDSVIRDTGRSDGSDVDNVGEGDEDVNVKNNRNSEPDMENDVSVENENIDSHRSEGKEDIEPELIEGGQTEVIIEDGNEDDTARDVEDTENAPMIDNTVAMDDEENKGSNDVVDDNLEEGTIADTDVVQTEVVDTERSADMGREEDQTSQPQIPTSNLEDTEETGDTEALNETTARSEEGAD